MRVLAICVAAVFLAASGCPQSNRVVPNDPLFSQQWHLEAVHLPEAWSITTGCEDVTLAVMDRDINLSGLDFLGSVCRQRYFDIHGIRTPSATFGHGSQVISVLGACSNNGVDLSGVDWKAKILPIQFADQALTMSSIAGILDLLNQYALPNGRYVDVINISAGKAAPDINFLKTLEVLALYRSVENTNRSGKIIVASAGNEHQNIGLVLPASLPGVISVGATKQGDIAMQLSNWGKDVTIMAPGQDVLVAPGVSIHGTSLAAPIVSGILSLMKSVNRDLNWKMARYILTITAKPMSCTEYCSSEYDVYAGARQKCQADCCRGEDNICTAGLVDAYLAVRMAQKGVPKVALVDAYPYLNLLTPTALEKEIEVANLGGAPGEFELVSSDVAHITLSPDRVSLAPGEKTIVKVRSDATSRNARISVRTLPYQENDPLSDSIELLVFTGVVS